MVALGHIRRNLNHNGYNSENARLDNYVDHGKVGDDCSDNWNHRNPADRKQFWINFQWAMNATINSSLAVVCVTAQQLIAS